MISKIKIWQFITSVSVLIAVVRSNYIISLMNLWFDILKSLVNEGVNIFSIFDYSLIDSLFSSLLIFIIPIVFIINSRLKKIFSSQLKLSNAVLTLLMLAFIFAPLITLQNPEFQKDIRVTKLLQPFSVVKYVELKKNIQTDFNELQILKSKVDEIIPKSYKNEIVYFDSSLITNSFKYYQTERISEIELSKLKCINGKPVVRTKMFLLGSDEYGRDVFTRIIFGSRISLLVGFGAVIVSLLLGIILAFIAAENGGVLNLVISRITDLFLTFPAIFLVMLILALFGSNVFSIIVVLGFTGWMSLFKIAKSEIISIKSKEYYLSAKLIGLKNSKLLIREILPVIIVPVMVNLIFQFSNVVLAESALSFLGLGLGNNYPSWGAMIESGQRYIEQSWWLIFMPGFVLVVTLLSINELGRKISKSFNPTFE
ncbi:MAG: ABC transporter permease [Ignavibacteriales bacterium]|jgi:peptide/nickel transport system permease protein|nr:ABC transporter permease [Ignavibacteriales bacterium]